MHPTIFGDNSKSFTTSENAPYVHFLREEKIIAFHVFSYFENANG